MPSRSLRECARTAATVASEDREWTPRLYHPESAVSMGRARFFTAKHCNALGRIRVQNSETSCPQRDATRFVDLMSHLRLSNNFDATSSFCSLLSPSALGYSGESSAHAIPSTLGSGSMPHGTTCDVLADPPHRAPSFTKAFQLVPRLAALSARDESGGPTPCPAPSSAASLSPRSVTASVSSAAASFESVGTSLSVAAAQTPPAQAKPDGDDADVAATLVSLLPAPFSALPVRRAAVGSLPVRHAAVASLSLAASRDAKVASATSSASTRPSSEPSQCRHIVCKLTDHTGRWHQESRDRLAAHTACWRDYGSNGRCSYCSHRRLLLADMLEQVRGGTQDTVDACSEPHSVPFSCPLCSTLPRRSCAPPPLLPLLPHRWRHLPRPLLRPPTRPCASAVDQLVSPLLPTRKRSLRSHSSKPPRPPRAFPLTRGPLPAAAPARTAPRGSARTWAATRRTRTSSRATTTRSTTAATAIGVAGSRTGRRAAAPGARTGHRSSPAPSRRRAAAALPRTEEALAKTSRPLSPATHPQSRPKIISSRPASLLLPVSRRYLVLPARARLVPRPGPCLTGIQREMGYSAATTEGCQALSRAVIQCRLGIVSLL